MRHHGLQLVTIALTFGAGVVAYIGVLDVPDHQSGLYVVGIVAVACAGVGGVVYLAHCLIQPVCDGVEWLHDAVERRAAAPAAPPAPARPAPGTPGRPVPGEPAQWDTMRRRSGGCEPTELIPVVPADDDMLAIGWAKTRTPKPRHRAPAHVPAHAGGGSWRGNGWGL